MQQILGSSNRSRIKAIQAAIAQRQNSSVVVADRYRENIAAYANDILSVRLTPQQTEIADRLPIDKRILAPAGNEVGKSLMGAVLALHHYDCFIPGLTIATAPADKQITQILFREIRSLAPKRKGWRPRANHLEDAANHFLTGLVAKGDTPFQGRHEAHVLLIFDEAEGIPLEFWTAGHSFADWWVCLYNPTLTSSPAATAERSADWKTIRLNALEHPNILAALRGEPPPFPKAVTLDKVKYRLRQWATRVVLDEPTHPDDIVLDGERWRLGPVAQARILGRRPSGGTNSVFSDGLWQKLIAAQHALNEHLPLQIGCDVGRFGDDYTAIVIRRGFVTTHIEVHNGWNTRQTAERLKDLAVRSVNSHEDPKKIPVVIDDTGVGGGVVDQADGFRFVGINFGALAEDTEKYPDVRSELWFDFVDIVDGGYADISRVPHDIQNTLRDQLLSPLYELDKKGRRVLESKKKTKERLGQGSPDVADALVLAYSPHASFYETYTVIK